MHWKNIDKFLLFLSLVILILILNGCSEQMSPQNVNCDKLKSNVVELMDQSNYCEIDFDCEISTEFIEYGCDFGCYKLFNKNADLTKIGEELEKYRNCPFCEFKCGNPPNSKDIKCINSKCVNIEPES